MNKIKNSFSKIKASDEFKDKLAKELLNGPKELETPKRNIYFNPRITAAALLFVLVGIISLRLIVHNNERGGKNLDSLTYAPQEDFSMAKDNKQDDNKSNEENQDTENNINTKDAINKSNNNDKSINRDDLTSNSSESYILPKVEITSEKNNVREDVNSNASDNITALSPKTIPSKDDSLNSSIAFSSIANTNLVYVPKIDPYGVDRSLTAKMMPLIVYKERVYVYVPIQISSENVKNLLGKKLGTTSSNINELSTQLEYSNEFASNIGVTDVYSVNGYDEDFRVMTNIITEDGKSYPEIYECLNGITIQNGADIFTKLKLQGNITQAKFQTFSDWNSGIGDFYTINDSGLLNNLLEELNKGIPYLPEDIESSIGDFQNDDELKQISLDLKDGTKNITITILKSGYAYYGYPRVYFKIDNNFTEELWDKLSIMRIN